MESRINQILEYLHLSSAQFADTIGVQRSSISHILSGRNKPSFDFIQKILLKYPEFDANWLITGNGSILLDSNSKKNAPEANFEADLFSKTPLNKEKDDISSTKDKILYSSLNSLNESVPETAKNTEITNVNNVKSIIIVYEDDTFKYLNSK